MKGEARWYLFHFSRRMEWNGDKKGRSKKVGGSEGKVGRNQVSKATTAQAASSAAQRGQAHNLNTR